MQKAEFVIIARGGYLTQPYITQVTLDSTNPVCQEWLADDNESDFDDWCNWELNEMAYELEQNGASVIVLSLEEYRTLPKY